MIYCTLIKLYFYVTLYACLFMYVSLNVSVSILISFPECVVNAGT